MNAGYSNPYLNPYGLQPQNYQQPYQIGPQMQVTKVNGENGARSFQIGANSSAILLDESGLLIWLVTTDGAAYKTVTAYDITPHKEAAVPDYGSLECRITRLEEWINANASDTVSAKKKSSSKSIDGES